MPSRNAGTRASDAGKRGACCRGTQGARGDACWGTRDACCRSLGPCCKRGKGHALPHPHRRPRTRGLRSAQGKPVMADAGRGRACRRDARGACCGGGTRACAHAEKRACQRHKKVFLVPILGGDNAISVLQMRDRAARFAVLDVLPVAPLTRAHAVGERCRRFARAREPRDGRLAQSMS